VGARHPRDLEAAMVGGLADWFAVSALFRRIPTGIPFITAHTDVIPRSKDRIADNLSAFVKEKFLAPHSLVELIRQHDPSRYVAEWLTDPANARRLGAHLARATEGVLHLVEDARIEQLVRDAAREMFKGVDLSSALGGVLDTLTRDGRHDQLLEQALDRALRVMDSAETREWMAAQVIEWLTQEHPRKQKLLPRQWIAQNVAAAIADAVAGRLKSIRANPAHAYRQLFDEWVRDFVLRLQSEPQLRARRGHQAVPAGRRGLRQLRRRPLGSLKAWLQEDLRNPQSAFHQGVASGGRWLGEQLTQDAEPPGAARATGRSGHPARAGVCGVPHPPRAQHRARMGRARDGRPDRAEHRQGPAGHPRERHDRGRCHRPGAAPADVRPEALEARSESPVGASPTDRRPAGLLGCRRDGPKYA
jgi:uncharacterized membrane-anchored protein YjiN (DUF445 family)